MHAQTTNPPKRAQQSLFLACACLSLTCSALNGCAPQADNSAPVQPSEADAPNAQDDTAAEELATLEGDGYRLTFLSLDDGSGTLEVGMREDGLVSAPNSPVAALVARGFTPLEIYIALGGPDTLPPEELVRAHAAQAEREGRDASVRSPGAIRRPSHDKSVKSCKDKTFVDVSGWAPDGDHWENSTGATYASGISSQYVGNVSSYSTTRPVVLAACNDSPSATLSASYAYRKNWDGQAWENGSVVAVNPGGYVVWYWRWSFSHGCTATANGCVGDCYTYAFGPGFACGVKWHGASYKVTGRSSGSYVLATAVWMTTIEPPN
jgi:hypothetical protein